MSERIRWEDNASPIDAIASRGYAGKLEPRSFIIYKPEDRGGQYRLLCLVGERKSLYADDPDELKATAERWLSEFISSLGAVFPDFTSVTRFETIDHTRGLASISLDSTRAVVAYGTSVKLSVQDDGRTLKVFLGIPGEPATEEPQ